MVAVGSQLTHAESHACAARQARRNRLTLVALLILIAGMAALGLWHVTVEMQAAQAARGNSTFTAD